MKLRVRHTTEYVYGETVPLCHNVVHLCPRDTERQRVLDHELTISPEPTVVRSGTDFFGNPVAWFSLQESHHSLTVTAVSTVDVMQGASRPQTSPPWEQAVVRPGQGGDDAARDYAFDSPYVPTHDDLADYATTSFPRERPVHEAAIDLMHRIATDFKFKSGVTSVGTPVLDVLRNRQGVCQDFTHLMIGMFRSLGLPARYVSGYLLTRPPPGRPRMVGADASHAWPGVWVPGFGWMDLDPTNDCLPDHRYAVVGWGRDYGDLSPVRGIIVGGHQHSLKVGVDVEPIDEAILVPSPGTPSEG